MKLSVLEVFLFGVALYCVMPLASADLPLQACSNYTHIVYGNNVRFTMHGTQVKVSPAFPDGSGYDDSVALYLQIQDLIEKRTNFAFGGCAAVFDLPLYRLDLTKCNCTYHTMEIIKPGVNDSGAYFNISGCPAPYQDVVVLTRATVANTTYEDYYNETMPGSSQPNFTYVHPGGSLKFGLTVENWNWSRDPLSDRGGYLSTNFYVGLRSDTLPIFLNQSTSETSANLYASMGPYLFSMAVELGIILDGVPSISVKANQTLPIPPSLPGGTGGEIIGIASPVAFCQAFTDDTTSLTKWKNIYFDPTLGVLFNTMPSEPMTPEQAAKAKANRPWVLAVAITLPIIFVVAVVVVLAITVPAVKAFFRPFVARNKTPSSGALITPGQAGDSSHWQRVSRPSHNNIH